MGSWPKAELATRAMASAKADGTPEAVWARDVGVGASGRVLTDAWAPVEYLQAKVFLRGLGWSPGR